MDESQKNIYEITFYTKAEDAAPVKAAVVSSHGAVVEEKSFEKVKLEFPIKKESFVFLGAMKVSLEPSAVREVSHALGLAPEVLRHLITIVPPATVEGEGEMKDVKKSSVRPRATAPVRSAPKDSTMLTNEAIEKKIEEIMK